jgi:hypothetical protein
VLRRSSANELPAPANGLGNFEIESLPMAKRQSDDLRRWAVLGAEQRLVQLGEEARTIFRHFPELRSKGRGFQAQSGEAPFPWRQQGRQTKVANSSSSGESQPKRRRRRKMSREARRLISEAMKARWAKTRATRGKGERPKPRTMSPEARAKISATQKARWATQRARKK